MRQRSTSTYRKLTSAVLAVGVAVPLAKSQAPAPAAVVPLSAGTCPSIHDGEIVTFDWNPAFDPSAGVAGLKNFELAFSLPGRPIQNRPGLPSGPVYKGGGLLLSAVPRPGMAKGAGNSITDLGNGFYRVRFRVDLAEHPPGPPGEYVLVLAHAQPILSPDFKGDVPKMTNSPVNSYFCLNVPARQAVEPH